MNTETEKPEFDFEDDTNINAFPLVGGKSDVLGAALFDSHNNSCLLYTSPSPRDGLLSRMPSSA